MERHFVFVHGACHGAWCWYKVSAILKSSGHKVTALDMGASGINSKQVHEVKTLSDYFEPLMEFMKFLPDKERVVLVGHSMGGTGISVAMQSFPHKISVAVFLGASMPGPNFGSKRIAEKYAQKPIDFMDMRFLFGNGPDNPPTAALHGPNFLKTKYYRHSPLEDLELGLMLVRPIPVYDKAEKEKEIILTTENYGSIRRVYIVCDPEDDEAQRFMIENNPPDEVMVVSGSDHMAMFSNPKELSSYLLDIGNNYP